jgi:hypothetical protein
MALPTVLRTPTTPPITASAGAALAAGLLLALAPTSAHAARYVECQKPVVTGVEVSQLHHVTSHTACPVALNLFRWEQRDGNERRLFRCNGFKPVLKKHEFDGWHLRIQHTYGFTMYRGSRSFVVGGTDFPLNCS